MNNTANTTDNAAHVPAENEIHLGGDAGPRVAPPSRLIELLQVSHVRGQSAHYTIFDQRYLSVCQKHPLRKSRHYWLDLGFLDPTPHLLSVTDWRSLYAATGLAFGTLIMLTLSILSSTPWLQQPWLPLTAILAVATVVATASWLMRSRNFVRFHSISGDAVFLEMVNNSPSRKEFAQFLRSLIQHIQAAHKHDPRRPYQKLGVELCEHRRLAEGGILSQDAYDHAREKILRRHRQANIRPTTKAAKPRPEPEHAEIIEVTVANGGWQVTTAKADKTELFPQERRARA